MPCLEISGNSAYLCEAALAPLIGTEPTGTGLAVSLGLCASMVLALTSACTYSVYKGNTFTQDQARTMLGCDITDEFIPAGVRCEGDDIECQTGICSNFSLGGKHYCCPGDRPGEPGRQVRKPPYAGMRFCKRRCVGEGCVCHGIWCNLSFNPDLYPTRELCEELGYSWEKKAVATCLVDPNDPTRWLNLDETTN